MDKNERRALRIAIFSILQIQDENQYEIPIFLFGDVLYNELLKGKNIVKYQDFAFPMLWQAFFDSILTDSYKHILKNQAILFSSIFISKNV